jgi:hypothetical protein
MDAGAGTGDAVDRWARDRAGGVLLNSRVPEQDQTKTVECAVVLQMGDGRNACKVGQKSEKLKVDNKLSTQQQQQAACPLHRLVG